MERRSK